MYFKTLPLAIFVVCLFFLTEALTNHENYIRSLHQNNKIGHSNEPTLKKLDKKITHKQPPNRWKREFTFNIDADHEEGVGTDLVATLNANLYKTGNTRLDATARYSKHYNDYGTNGNARYGGSLHFQKF